MRRTHGWIVVIAMMIALIGCGKGPDGNQQIPEDPAHRPHHEQDFSVDAQRVANFHDTVILNLEAAGSHEGDSGDAGFDVIPYKYHRAVNQMFCFRDDEDEEADHYMVLKDSAGAEVLRVTAGDCVRARIEAGSYTKEIHHGRKGEADIEPEPVFIYQAAKDFTPENAQTRGYPTYAQALSPRPPSLAKEEDTTCAQGDNQTYSELSLNPGDVAVFTGSSCPPGASDSVKVYNGSCHDTGGKITGFKVGPYTQVVVFSKADYDGAIYSRRHISGQNRQYCFVGDADHQTGNNASIKVSRYDGDANATCIVEQSGSYCINGFHNCNSAGGGNASGPDPLLHFESLRQPGSGEVAILGDRRSSRHRYGWELHPGTLCCAHGHIISGSCEDLSLIGFDDALDGVVMGARGSVNTVLTVYENEFYGGVSRIIAPGEFYSLDNLAVAVKLPASGDSFAMARTISSLIVETNNQQDAITLISTKHCGGGSAATGCNLQGVNLERQNMNYAAIPFADLTNAKLHRTQFVNAMMNNVTLTGADCTMANFSQATMTDAVLDSPTSGAKTNLTQALLRDTNLRSASLKDVTLHGVQFFDTGANQASLQGAFLNDADFSPVISGEETTQRTVCIP